MHAPTAKSSTHVWLPPVHYGLKPYLEFCGSIDKSLRKLEARHRSRRKLSIQNREQMFRHE